MDRDIELDAVKPVAISPKLVTVELETELTKVPTPGSTAELAVNVIEIKLLLE